MPHVEDFLQEYLAQPETEPHRLLKEKPTQWLQSLGSILNGLAEPKQNRSDCFKAYPTGCHGPHSGRFKSCLRLNYFLRLWKTVKIIIPKPVKSRRPMCLENCCLISLLLVISKVFERLLNIMILSASTVYNHTPRLYFYIVFCDHVLHNYYSCFNYDIHVIIKT